MGKGELIMPENDRIITRSQSKQSELYTPEIVTFYPAYQSDFQHYLDPDQYTIVSAPLKIIKVLIEELLSASGNARNIESAGAVAAANGDSDDDEWEDDPADLDLAAAGVKKGKYIFLNIVFILRSFLI